MLSRLRNIARTTARPTATSPAATAMVKTAKTWPLMAFSCRLKAMRFRLAAFIISSIDIRMMMALRRVRTPMTPIAKRSRLTTRTWPGGTGMCLSLCLRLARPDDGGDHRDQQQDGRDLERQERVPEHRLPDRFEVAAGPQRRFAGRRLEAAAHVEAQHERRQRQAETARDDRVQADLPLRHVAQVDQHD